MTGFEVTVRLAAVPGVDAEELAECSQRLRSELIAAGVGQVEAVEEPAPDGARGVAEVLGVLSACLGIPADLYALVAIARDWASRNQQPVDLVVYLDGHRLEVSGDRTPAQQDALICAFIERHARPGT